MDDTAPIAAGQADAPPTIELALPGWLPPSAETIRTVGLPAVAFATSEARKLLRRRAVTIPPARGRRSLAATIVIPADVASEPEDLVAGLLAVLVELGALKGVGWASVRIDALQVVRGGRVGTAVKLLDLPRVKVAPAGDVPPIKRGRRHLDGRRDADGREEL